MVRARRAIGIATACLCFFAAVLALFLPLPVQAQGAAESYICRWENGTETEESYFSAYSALEGTSRSGGIALFRDGERGEIAGGEDFHTALNTLEEGDLGMLYGLRAALNRIERAALWRRFGGRVWYSGEAFVWTGERVVPATSYKKKELVLLEGGIAAGVLKKAGAETLFVRAAATVKPENFAGTALKRVYAQPPYAAEEVALYLDTLGGRRLVAALPNVKSLFVSDCAFADRGALISCEKIGELSLPFAGNALHPVGSGYTGEVAWLFRKADGFCVPKSLLRITVRGGSLCAYAFYACPCVEEVNACGVAAERISKQAFAGMGALKLLHTPRKDVLLDGSFASRIAPCGCTVYERSV